MNWKPIIAFALGLMAAHAEDNEVRQKMQRAQDFGQKSGALVIGNDVSTWWAAEDAILFFRTAGKDGTLQYSSVNPETGEKQPAFDHGHLATALAAATNRPVDASRLTIDQIRPTSTAQSIRLRAFGKNWIYSNGDHALSSDHSPIEETPLLAPEEAMGGTRRTGENVDLIIENGLSEDIEIFWIDGGGIKKSYGKISPGKQFTQSTYAGHVWLMTRAEREPLASLKTPDTPSFARVTHRIASTPRDDNALSPDGKWRATIENHNLFLTPLEGGARITVTKDGTLEHAYGFPVHWSPDSKRIVFQKTKRVVPRKIHIIQTSPQDQIQPRLKEIDYPKPGDPIRQPMPCLFDLEGKKLIPLDHSLFANPWSIRDAAWSGDSSEFSFVYNQRGHQVMRIIGINGVTGEPRVIHEETSKTFIDYSQKYFIHRLPGDREILWASERDGHNHLLLLDVPSGKVKNQITRGNFEVREVVDIDAAKRQATIRYVGDPGQDPYHVHFARVGFDDHEFSRLTSSDGTHRITFSPGKKYLVATWSRVDQPPVAELRRADDDLLVTVLSQADDSALLQTGWSRPERFVAKGRDGTTDIHGIIIRPKNFDPTKRYPVVEDIYAGPHDHFVPKSYFTWSGKNSMAELGFIVVSIDGMGTNWRGKTFHDVCWKNLMDAGLPDRIAWIRAAAESRPWMDLSRVGIYGGSAGGQSTLAALLHHGDFYKVGVSDCGCHDNRMDKIWWNEAWMGWPVDDSYARNSNVTHAGLLAGKLMLIVGEMDTNVDPASTYQVVSALQKAGKDFDFVPIMNAGHGAAETPYGSYRRAEFLTRHLGGPETGN